MPLSAAIHQTYLGKQRPAFILELRTEGGLVGWGEASPFPEFGTETVAECEVGLQKFLHFVENSLDSFLGTQLNTCLNTPIEPDSNLNTIYQIAHTYSPCARHAIEQALLHLCAQGRPIAPLLTPNYLPQIFSNGLIPKLPIDRATARAKALFAQGYTCLKVKVGGEPFAESYGRLQAVCIDRRVTLRVDANQAWTTSETLSYLPRLQQLPVEYLEQPIDHRDWQGLAHLRQHIPIAIDEGVRHLTDLEIVIRQNLADYLILKPMFIGGILTGYRWGKCAQEAGLQVIVTNSLDGHWATWGALQLASALGISAPCGFSTVAQYRKSDQDPDRDPNQHSVFLLTRNPQSVAECNLTYCLADTPDKSNGNH